MALNLLIESFWDGDTMTYSRGFASTLSKSSALVGGIICCASFIVYGLIYWLQRKKKIIKVTEGDYERVFDENNQDENLNPWYVILLEIFADFFFWFGFFLVVFMFPVFSGFNIMNTGSAVILCQLLLYLALIHQVFRCALFLNQPQSIILRMRAILNKYRYLFVLAFIILSFLAVFLPILSKNSCICIYNEFYGLPILLDMQYSSAMTRNHWISQPICQDKKICHLYATLPSDTSSAVFINIQTGRKINSISATLSHDTQIISEQCQNFPFPDDVDEKGQRKQFTCLFTGLNSNTMFDLLVKGDCGTSECEKYSRYQTLPSETDLGSEVKILFGGDLGYMPKGRNLIELVSDQKPDVILIGGDIAYDNGNKHCYLSWDLMLNQFEEQYVILNRTIPFILSVGNHDVGFNSMSNVQHFEISDQFGPLYFSYFPQHYVNETQKTGIPEIKSRRTYFYQKMKNIVLLALDSGYVNRFDGEQQQWLQSTLEEYSRKQYNLFSHYHNPIYPICMANKSLIMTAGNQQKAASQNWVPLFDKYGLLAAFENHVHQFKRTHPLINGKLSNDSNLGTVYFGDGAMGVKEVTCKEQDRTDKTIFEGLFALYQIEESSHMWFMNIQDDIVQYVAYTPQKNTITDSQYNQSLSSKTKIQKRDEL